jgi:hypothetical protein
MKQLRTLLLLAIASSVNLAAQDAKIHVQVNSDKCEDVVGITFAHQVREALRNSAGFVLDSTSAITLAMVCVDPFKGIDSGTATVAAIAITRATDCGVLYVNELVVTVPAKLVAKEAAFVLATLDNTFH